MPPKKAAPVATAPNPSEVPTASPTPAPLGASDTPNPNPGPGRPGRKKQSDVGAAPPTEIQLGIDASPLPPLPSPPVLILLQEYMMPRMMSVRLAKGVLPPQTLIHKDAATAMQYSTSLFLNHIANSANEHTLAAGRKNISPQDILAGMRDTEWEFLVPQLEEELAIYVRSVNDKRNEYRRRLKERDSGVGVARAGGEGADGDGDQSILEAGGEGQDRQSGRSAKRARLSEGVTMDESGLMEEDGHEEEGDEMMEEEEGAEQENGEEGSDEDEDDAEAYGSAAEALDSEPGDASENADEGSEEEGSEEEGDSD